MHMFNPSQTQPVARYTEPEGRFGQLNSAKIQGETHPKNNYGDLNNENELKADDVHALSGLIGDSSFHPQSLMGTTKISSVSITCNTGNGNQDKSAYTKFPSVSKVFQENELSNMEDLVEKLIKNDDEPIIDEERNQDENAINFDDFSKMMAATTEPAGNNNLHEPETAVKRPKSQRPDNDFQLLKGTFSIPLEDTRVFEEQRRLAPRNEMDIIENSNVQHTNSSRQSQQSVEKKTKASTNKQLQQKKSGLKSYSELVSVLDLLEKFDWLEDEIYQSKILPIRNITYNSIWFLISAQYFSKPPFIYHLPQQLFDKAIAELNSKFAKFPVRLTQSFVHANKIEEEAEPLNESESNQLDKLISSLRQASLEAATIQPQKIFSPHKNDAIISDGYSYEDDESIIELRQKMLDFAASRLHLDLSENVNVIQKLSLEDICNYFEAEHNKVACQNERSLESLGGKLLDQAASERWKIEFSLPPDDILVDLKYNVPNEEEYLNYLERKQLEGKDLLKPGEPVRHNTSGKYKPRIAPEDMVCQVCNDGDYTDDDLIVFCAKCNISVHQTCYGITKIPKNDWICDVCLKFGAEGRYLRCPFCVRRGGAMKPTVLCADTTFFQQHNPEFHEFLAKYANEPRIKTAKLQNKKPSRVSVKDLKKKKKKKKTSSEEARSISSESSEGSESDNKGKSKANNAVEKVNPGPSRRGKAPRKREQAASPESEENDNADEPPADLYYDWHYIDENYTDEDLKKEPRPERIWAHITCALFIPELFFQDTDKISDIDGFSLLSKDRFKLDCGICGKKKAGAIVNCEKSYCKKAFHPECARRAKLYLEIKECENTQLIYKIFCEKHTPLKLRRTLESKEKKQREDIYRFCKAVERYYSYSLQEPPKLLNKKSLQETHAKAEEKERTERNKKRDKNKHISKGVGGASSAQLYLNIVEEWRKKAPNNLYTITLAKTRHTVKDAENQITKEEIFKVLETNVPRANPLKKLGMTDQIWSFMPYKNYTPLQKYKKYKKIVAKIKDQEKHEKTNKYIKSTKRALREEQKNQPTKSNSLLRDFHLVVEDPDDNIYCICRQKYRADGTDDDMLACDGCGEWYHFGCVGFNQTLRKAKNAVWHCQKCRGVPFPPRPNAVAKAANTKPSRTDKPHGRGRPRKEEQQKAPPEESRGSSLKRRNPAASKENSQEPSTKKKVQKLPLPKGKKKIS